MKSTVCSVFSAGRRPRYEVQKFRSRFRSGSFADITISSAASRRVGVFAVGQDASAWGLHLGTLLASVRQENGKTTGASALVDYFLGELYALAISARGTAKLTHLVAATRSVLNIAPADLCLDQQGKLLRSSPAFEERFFHRVRVPIPRKPTGSVATHRRHAPHGTGRRPIR